MKFTSVWTECCHLPVKWVFTVGVMYFPTINKWKPDPKRQHRRQDVASINWAKSKFVCPSVLNATTALKRLVVNRLSFQHQRQSYTGGKTERWEGAGAVMVESGCGWEKSSKRWTARSIWDSDQPSTFFANLLLQVFFLCFSVSSSLVETARVQICCLGLCSCFFFRGLIAESSVWLLNSRWRVSGEG